MWVTLVDFLLKLIIFLMGSFVLLAGIWDLRDDIRNYQGHPPYFVRTVIRSSIIGVKFLFFAGIGLGLMYTGIIAHTTQHELRSGKMVVCPTCGTEVKKEKVHK